MQNDESNELSVFSTIMGYVGTEYIRPEVGTILLESITIIVAVPILIAILELIAILIAILELVAMRIAILELIAILIAILERIAILIVILELIAIIIAIFYCNILQLQYIAPFLCA